MVIWNYFHILSHEVGFCRIFPSSEGLHVIGMDAPLVKPTLAYLADFNEAFVDGKVVTDCVSPRQRRRPVERIVLHDVVVDAVDAHVAVG